MEACCSNIVEKFFQIKKVLNLNAARPFVSSSRIPNSKVRGVLVSGTRARREDDQSVELSRRRPGGSGLLTDADMTE